MRPIGILLTMSLALCVGCKTITKSQCGKIISTSADAAAIIADHTAKDEDRKQAVIDAAEMVKLANQLGCRLAQPDEDDDGSTD